MSARYTLNSNMGTNTNAAYEAQTIGRKVRIIVMEVIWRVALFGGLTAARNERTVTHFETRKTGALLCCLALSPERARAREMLAEQLWPDEDWDATRNRLRQALSALRRELEPPEVTSGSVLIADRNDVRLAAGSVVIDTAQFETALRNAGSAAHKSGLPVQIEYLRTAVALYKGGLLPGYYESCIQEERTRFEVLFHDALSQLVELLSATGELTEAMEYARRAVAADPLREDAHHDLMRLFAKAGRPTDVLRQYRAMELFLIL
jgi:DNA-binding SARP family transcriptional activator